MKWKGRGVGLAHTNLDINGEIELQRETLKLFHDIRTGNFLVP